MKKKGILEELATAVISLYKGARTTVKVGKYSCIIHIHQGSVLLPLLFAIVAYVVMNKIKEGMLQEILYADDIVLIAESMSELLEIF